MGNGRRRFCIVLSLICLTSGTELSFTDLVLSARAQESAVDDIDSWWQIVNGATAPQSPPTVSVRSHVHESPEVGLLGVVNRIRTPVLKDHRLDHRPKKKSPYHCGKAVGKAKKGSWQSVVGLVTVGSSDCMQYGKAKKKGKKGKGKGSSYVDDDSQPPSYEYDGRGPGLFTAGKGKRPSASSSHKSKRISIYSKPTAGPSPYPTAQIVIATQEPSMSISPSHRPTTFPSLEPTLLPSSLPTTGPTTFPSLEPTLSPSSPPTTGPTPQPTETPSTFPSAQPSSIPTPMASDSPSLKPTVTHSETPTLVPSVLPTMSMVPSVAPYGTPSSSPSLAPTDTPSSNPTSTPLPTTTFQPSMVPTVSGDVKRVPATPFNLDYLTTANLPDTIDPTVALQVTREYLESFLSFQLSFNQDAVLVDTVITLPAEGQVENPNLYVTPLQVVLQFEPDGILPGTVDVDVLIFTAFSPPFVEQLLGALQALGDGTFSTTNEVIYTPTG